MWYAARARRERLVSARAARVAGLVADGGAAAALRALAADPALDGEAREAALQLLLGASASGAAAARR